MIWTGVWVGLVVRWLTMALITAVLRMVLLQQEGRGRYIWHAALAGIAGEEIAVWLWPESAAAPVVMFVVTALAVEWTLLRVLK